MRRLKTQIPMHSNSIGCPKIFLCLLQFCTGYRIWHASRVSKRKTLIYTQLKISRYNQHFLTIFLPILVKMTSDLFTVVWPQRCYAETGWRDTFGLPIGQTESSPLSQPPRLIMLSFHRSNSVCRYLSQKAHWAQIFYFCIYLPFDLFNRSG